jgi:hypothetical protein
MALGWITTTAEKFKNDQERIKFLFGLYEEYLGE